MTGKPNRITSKVQRAPSQHDDLACFPSTGSRQGRGRRSVAARHRSRTVARCASRMEPAVRGPWIESPIITDRVRNVAFGSHPPQFPAGDGIWPLKILPRGTEFLDAETGG